MPGIKHLGQIRQSRLEVIHALADELLKQLKELSHFGLALFAWSAPEAIGKCIDLRRISASPVKGGLFYYAYLRDYAKMS